MQHHNQTESIDKPCHCELSPTHIVQCRETRHHCVAVAVFHFYLGTRGKDHSPTCIHDDWYLAVDQRQS